MRCLSSLFKQKPKIVKYTSMGVPYVDVKEALKDPNTIKRLRRLEKLLKEQSDETI
jgi:hypothetical protein